MGRSKASLSTKIHLASDALGYPLGFILTGANVSDFDQAKPLLRDQRLGKECRHQVGRHRLPRAGMERRRQRLREVGLQVIPVRGHFGSPEWKRDRWGHCD